MAAVLCLAGFSGCGELNQFGSELSNSYDEVLVTLEKSLNDGESAPEKAAPAEPDVIVKLDRQGVRRLQALLSKLGFGPGPVDGIMGSQTIRAVKKYQAAFALPVTDAISTRFLAHLEGMSGKDFAVRPTPPDQPGGQVSLSTGSPDTGHRPVTLTRSDLPTYLPGTTFLYSDGRTERVDRVQDLEVSWSVGDGTTYRTHRNFLLPHTYWISGRDRGTAKIPGAPDAFWPTAAGQSVSFDATVTQQRGNDAASTTRRIDSWRCQNEGAREITVEAGTFDTLVFVCRLGDNPSEPEKVRTWYYAKSVRHYVRYVEQDPVNDTSTEADLVAVRPGAPTWPPIVRAALTRALVHALEQPEESARMPWTSSGVNTRVTIEATSRFEGDDGEDCRRFVQIWSDDGVTRHYPAVACKTAGGDWSIPGLQNDPANSLATSGEVS